MTHIHLIGSVCGLMEGHIIAKNLQKTGHLTFANFDVQIRHESSNFGAQKSEAIQKVASATHTYPFWAKVPPCYTSPMIELRLSGPQRII